MGFLRRLWCKMWGHRLPFSVKEVWWGGHDYQRITKCERCGWTDRWPS